MNTPVISWLFPAHWQEDPEAAPSVVSMATELAISDGYSPENIEALFYGLLDLTDEEVVQRYYSRF